MALPENTLHTPERKEPDWWWSCGRSDGALDVTALRRLTRDYWRREGSLHERFEWYVENLFPHELAHAQARGALESQSCDTLVFLVGHSIEPLFQTVGSFQPDRVVLLLNRWYDLRDQPEPERGLDWGREIQALMDNLLVPLLSEPPAIELLEVADRPDAVFQVLSDHVLPDRQTGRAVIVDITGAKKSIVAGAFLFAAYADIAISYVDFDDYDEIMRRPLGFTCRIGTLTNPYDAFRLREWERVRRLYDNYHFRAAAEALADVLERPAGRAAASFGSFRPADMQAARGLLSLLRFYEAWDDGDYFRAKGVLRGLQRRLSGFRPPVAVTELGDVWPHAEGVADAQGAALRLLDMHRRLGGRPHSIFESNRLLVVYARDELAKIERLVEANEDNRSALLRAAGLDELLLKARLVRLWHASDEGRLGLWDHNERFLGSCCSLSDTELRDKLYDALLNHQGTDHMRKALRGTNVFDRRLGSTVPAFVRLDVWRNSYRARPTPGSPRLANYEQDTGLKGETLTQLRNQAIHMYLYVTQPVAQAAVALARANLREFKRTWAPLAGEVPLEQPADVARLPWDEVCRLCGLDFLPVAGQNVNRR